MGDIGLVANGDNDCIVDLIRFCAGRGGKTLNESNACVLPDLHARTREHGGR